MSYQSVVEEAHDDWRPWHRFPAESSRNLELFIIYRDMGPSRSLERVKVFTDLLADDNDAYEHYSMNQIKSLRNRFAWKKRAEAWDDHINVIIVEDHEKAAQEMVARQADVSKEFQELIYELRHEIDHIPQPTTKAWFLKTLTSGFREIAELERINRGEPTSNIEVKNGGLGKLHDIIQQSREKLKEVKESEGREEE
jgi:hypothetical protein